MQEIVAQLMKTEEAPGDYTGPDGLLYCGKCHTPNSGEAVSRFYLDRARSHYDSEH